MLLEKVVKQLELQKINEDSLVSAYASLKYANKMLANAHEKNLHSKQYWTDKKNHASKRIETLKSKGEEETEDTHKQADELLNKIEAKNKLGWKELLKNPEVRKNASNFVKEISNHVSLKAIIVHTSHHFHNLVKPVINTTKNFFKNPKSTISNLKETSKKYFKSVFRAGKNTKVIAVNANNAFKDIHKKYKTKFTEEEKKGLMNDPDKFLSKLHNSLTKEEINDIKMVSRHALNVATAALCVQYIGHITHNAVEITHALSKGITDASIEVCKEVGKEHLIGAMKESFINTSILALDLAENTAHLSESNILETNEDFSNLFGCMVPFITMYNNNPKFQQVILKSIRKSLV